MRNVCVKIFSAGSCRSTCARSLYEDLLCKMFVSGSLHQEPVGPLVQDRCMRFFGARCLRQDLLSRIL